jgi:hypothetical protein
MKNIVLIFLFIFANCLGQKPAFQQGTKFKLVSNINDYENITLINSVEESVGLYKIGHVSASSGGIKMFNSKEDLEKKTITKLKMGGALMGASVIRVANMLIKNKEYSVDWDRNKELAGTAYSLTPLDFDAFAKLLGNKSEYFSVSGIELSSTSVNFSKRDKTTKLNVTSLKKEDYAIIINGKLHGDAGKYQVVYFDSESFDVFFMDDKGSYRIKFKI